MGELDWQRVVVAGGAGGFSGFELMLLLMPPSCLLPVCHPLARPPARPAAPAVDISIAVATEAGLITPIIRGADKKSLAAIAAEVGGGRST